MKKGQRGLLDAGLRLTLGLANSDDEALLCDRWGPAAVSHIRSAPELKALLSKGFLWAVEVADGPPRVFRRGDPPASDAQDEGATDSFEVQPEVSGFRAPLTPQAYTLLDLVIFGVATVEDRAQLASLMEPEAFARVLSEAIEVYAQEAEIAQFSSTPERASAIRDLLLEANREDQFSQIRWKPSSRSEAEDAVVERWRVRFLTAILFLEASDVPTQEVQ